MRRSLTTLGTVIAAVALTPATALASTAGVSGGVLTYVGGSEANTVTITRSGTAFVVSDTTATETPLAGCTSGASGTVTCPASGVTRLEIRTGGGDDTVRVRAATPATLFGGTGDDLLSGGSGNDVLDGEGGADELGGGSTGRDTVTYATRTASVVADFDGVADDGTIGDASGGRRDDIHDSVDVILGGKAADTLTGDDRPTKLDGGEGDDALSGGLGADDLIGGDGLDTARYTGRTTGVTVDIDANADDGSVDDTTGARRDLVDPTVEHLTGGLGNDTLIGSAGVNTLHGGPGGNDTLLGLGGADDLIGGSASDTVSYERSTGKVVADLDGVRDDGGTGDANRTDLIRTDVENLTGGTAGDELTGNAQDNVFDGGPGPDKLVGGAGARDAVTYARRTSGVTVILGTDLNGNQLDAGGLGVYDSVDTSIEDAIGTPSADSLNGSDGNNRLYGGGGDDGLRGGGGDDLLAGEDGTDRANYFDHQQKVTVSLDEIANDGSAGEGDDARTEEVLGGDAGDQLIGDGKANRLMGGSGDDTFSGGGGPDTFEGNDGSDTVSYASSSSPVSVSIDGQANDGPALENDDVETTVEGVRGSPGDDVIRGGDGANVLFGGAGDDRLEGEGSADALDGESGADVIDGGDGQDVVYYFERPTGVVVDIDDQPDDGNGTDADGTAGTTRDNVKTTVEIVVGSLHADTLTAGPGGSQLYGFPGNDSLTGGPGNDRLLGGSEDDALAGLGGADELDGGDDHDSVSYAERDEAQPITVTIDALANDGGPGEGDKVVATVETVFGGAGADVLTGDGNPNTFFGGAGDDDLYGGGGNDSLTGDEGSDDLYGEAGDDWLNSAGDGFGTNADHNSCGEGPGGEDEDNDSAVGDPTLDSYDSCENVTN